MSDDVRWADLREKRAVVPPHVVFRSLAHETVLLNVESGMYHSVDRIGARFFDVAREAERLAEAPGLLAAEFDQPVEVIEADLAAFCQELAALGLVELAD